MELSEVQREILFNSYVLFKAGKGQVVNDHALPDAHELVDQGWLEARTEPNGATSYWWTPAAENALALTRLRRSLNGRQN